MGIMMKIEHIAASVSTTPGNAMLNDALETAFLAEMLQYTQPASSAGTFSGGAGEAQFASFLTREHAGLLAESLDFRLGPMSEGRA